MMIKIGYNKSDRHYGFSTHYECPDRINVCVRNLKKFYSNEYFITNLDSSLKGTESDSDTELVQYESILELIKLVHKDEYIKHIQNPTISHVVCRNCKKKIPSEYNSFENFIINTPNCEHCNETIKKSNIISYLSVDTYVTPYTFSVILDAVNVLSKLVEELAQNKILYGFALIRPPGHHCNNDANGFCHVNNAMIASKYAQIIGYSKVLILDIDFHHGDGTEKLIKSSTNFNSIYMVSIHGYGELVYPGTGNASDSNSNILNIPIDITIHPESRNYVTDEFYQNLFDTKALPWIHLINPDFIIISNGYDSHREDELEGFNITDKTYLHITNKLKLLHKPLLFITEGGYSIQTISRVTYNMIELLNQPILDDTSVSVFSGIIDNSKDIIKEDK